MFIRGHLVTCGLASLLLLSAACSDDDNPPADTGVPDTSQADAGPDQSVGSDLAPDVQPDAGPAKPTTQCVVGMGGAGIEAAGSGEGMHIDSSGNIYIAAGFESTATFGSKTLTSAGSLDAVVAKLDSACKVVWAVSAGGTGKDFAWGVTTDASGNVYATGSFSDSAKFGSTTKTSNGVNDIWVAKLDATGAFKWIQAFGSTGEDEGNSVAIDSKGDLVLAGYFGGAMTMGSTSLSHQGVYDLYVAKLDATTGAPKWAIASGSSMPDVINAMTVDASDNIYATGLFYEAITLNGTGGSSAKLTTKAKTYGYYLLKTDGNGKVLWAKAGESGGPSDSMAVGYHVAVAPGGDVLTTGFFVEKLTIGGKVVTSNGEKDQDVFVARHDASGNLKWLVSPKSGGDDEDWGIGVGSDSSGNALVAGGFAKGLDFGGACPALTSLGEGDGFVAKLDKSTGKCLWAGRAGSTSTKGQEGVSIGEDGAGNLYVYGRFAGSTTFDFGSSTLTAKGESDLYLWKLK